MIYTQCNIYYYIYIYKLLRDNITATYQKTEDSTVAKINKEAKAIASKLKLDERIERFPTRKAFITLKDHKPNFVNNPKCRLINPAKSEIGMISKKCLDKINKVIRSKANLHQWRNTYLGSKTYQTNTIANL